MATRSTLDSAKFEALLKAQPIHARFVLQPCDDLADAIERGVRSGYATETIAHFAHYIWAMGCFYTKKWVLDTLVPGCTHYVFAEPHLRKLLGPAVQLISTGKAVARQTRQQLQRKVDTSPAVNGSLTLQPKGTPGGCRQPPPTGWDWRPVRARSW